MLPGFDRVDRRRPREEDAWGPRGTHTRISRWQVQVKVVRLAWAGDDGVQVNGFTPHPAKGEGAIESACLSINGTRVLP
jgi:hypothetical protein